MSRARDTSKIQTETAASRLAMVHEDGLIVTNEDVFEADLTVAANSNVAIVGPVTIPNVTINGNLNAMKSLNVTGTLSFGSAGMLNIIG
tara:strand:+ start:22 stop:288 length:267 start_codon:yes stop_codon:yes gene_type:complete